VSVLPRYTRGTAHWRRQDTGTAWGTGGVGVTMNDDFENAHEDYAPPPKSARRLVADNVARYLFTAGLRTAAESEGAARSGDGRCYRAPFARPAFEAYGAVEVFSPEWLRVEWRAEMPGMPAAGSRVYATPEDALAFVALAFADGRPDLALAVPVRTKAGY
jgi:hypothetical protein